MPSADLDPHQYAATHPCEWLVQKTDRELYIRVRSLVLISMALMDLRSIVRHINKDNIIFYDSINITVYCIRTIVLKLLIVSSKSLY